MKSQTLLTTLTEKKVARNELNKEIKQVITEAIGALLTDIKVMEDTIKEKFKANGQDYVNVNRGSVLKLIKATLDSKESVINTAFNIIELKLSIDYGNLSLSEINTIIKCNKEGIEGFSKATINKCSSDKLKDKVKAYRESLKKD